MQFKALPLTAAIALPCALAFAAALTQSGGKQALDGHVSKLASAQALTAKLTAQRLPGAPTEWTVQFSRPNYLRIESPTHLWVSDGKSLYSLDKAKNSYAVEVVASDTCAKIAGIDETAGWAAFFDPKVLADAKSVTLGSKRNIKGNATQEVTYTLGGKTFTLYLDSKLGIARGFSLKSGDAESLILASEIAVLDNALDASAFAFAPPAGATKIDPSVARELSFADVAPIFMRNCSSCHNSSRLTGGIDLTSYASIMKVSGLVRPGDPDNSILYGAVSWTRGRSMPPSGGKLPQSDIDAIRKWIADGAKN